MCRRQGACVSKCVAERPSPRKLSLAHASPTACAAPGAVAAPTTCLSRGQRRAGGDRQPPRRARSGGPAVHGTVLERGAAARASRLGAPVPGPPLRGRRAAERRTDSSACRDPAEGSGRPRAQSRVTIYGSIMGSAGTWLGARLVLLCPLLSPCERAPHVARSASPQRFIIHLSI